MSYLSETTIFQLCHEEATMKLKHVCSLELTCDKSRQCIQKQRYHFANKGPYSEIFAFYSNHVWM